MLRMSSQETRPTVSCSVILFPSSLSVFPVSRYLTSALLYPHRLYRLSRLLSAFHVSTWLCHANCFSPVTLSVVLIPYQSDLQPSASWTREIGFIKYMRHKRRVFLQPWRWRQNISPNCWQKTKVPPGATTQKAAILRHTRILLKPEIP